MRSGPEMEWRRREWTALRGMSGRGSLPDVERKRSVGCRRGRGADLEQLGHAIR